MGEPSSAASNEQPDRLVDSAARALLAGARLDGFEVDGIIGGGSVAIVYAATDHERAAPVAIAEYMPARLAQRNDEARVVPRTPAQADAFAKGLKAFIKESHALSRCDHPSLVRMVRLCELNSTAYRVMPRYPARRLVDRRQEMSEPPHEQELLALLDALLGALAAYHHVGGCHGKVTPSNILMLAEDRPLLLGPGGATRAIASDRIDPLSTAPEPCFAPIEQIVEPDKPLHPSVDLYALAGVARYWMSGELPAPAFGSTTGARPEKVADTVQRLCRTWPQLHYSASLLDALDNALSIYPAERPQSVGEMRARLPKASPTARGRSSAPWTAAPLPDEAVPSSPSPALQIAPASDGAQDFDAVMASSPDPDPLATSGDDRIENEVPVRIDFAPHRVSERRRITLWGSAVLVLLALPIAILEFDAERLVGRARDVLGIERDTSSGARVPASAAGSAAPVTPPIAADTRAAQPMRTEPTTGDPPASDTASAIPTRPDDVPAAATNTTPPAVERPIAPAPPPMRVAQQRPSRAPTTPREVCGARTHFSLYRCMQTQCSRPQWASHAQCERFRVTDSVE